MKSTIAQTTCELKLLIGSVKWYAINIAVNNGAFVFND